ASSYGDGSSDVCSSDLPEPWYRVQFTLSTKSRMRPAAPDTHRPQAGARAEAGERASPPPATASAAEAAMREKSGALRSDSAAARSEERRVGKRRTGGWP